MAGFVSGGNSGAGPWLPDTAGGALLAGRGLDYARVHAVLDAGEVSLPADPRSVEAYLAAVAAQGTEQVVRALLEEVTRARRLVEAMERRP
ncbi:hypothetical protein ABZW30_21465 [Kitasatospora sp. NPDC004669]|uniref:hypothetical protein n=1 Tax=Kitasatospora sp. NPDC004669 TaxID=3154555 RepID=UPI0033A78D6A